MTPETAFWFLSTLAQCLATVIGLYIVAVFYFLIGYSDRKHNNLRRNESKAIAKSGEGDFTAIVYADKKKYAKLHSMGLIFALFSLVFILTGLLIINNNEKQLNVFHSSIVVASMLLGVLSMAIIGIVTIHSINDC